MRKLLILLAIILFAFTTVEATIIKQVPVRKPTQLETGADTYNTGWWVGEERTLVYVGDLLATKDTGVLVSAFSLDSQTWQTILWTGSNWSGNTTYVLKKGDLLAIRNVTTIQNITLAWQHFPNNMALDWEFGDIVANSIETSSFTLNGDMNLSSDDYTYNIEDDQMLAIIGTESTGVGEDAGTGNKGSRNTFTGYRCGQNADGNYNTYNGAGAGGTASEGSDNSIFGAAAGDNMTTAFNNSVFGSRAGGNLDRGQGNVFVGDRAGRNNDGDRNIFLGSQAGENESGSDLLYIEPTNSSVPLIKGYFNNDHVEFNASHKVSKTLNATYYVGIDAVIDNTTTPARDPMGIRSTFTISANDDDVYGILSTIQPSTFSLKNAYGMYSKVEAGGGTVDEAYGGYFEANADTNAYGVYAKASGSGKAWAGYFDGEVSMGDAEASSMFVDGDLNMGGGDVFLEQGTIYFYDGAAYTKTLLYDHVTDDRFEFNDDVYTSGDFILDADGGELILDGGTGTFKVGHLTGADNALRLTAPMTQFTGNVDIQTGGLLIGSGISMNTSTPITMDGKLSGSETFQWNGSAFAFTDDMIIGNGEADRDFTLTFDGETNDGVITWQEDEDSFDMSCDLNVSGGVNSSGFAFYSDQDTGFDDVAADTIGVMIGGGQKFEFNSTTFEVGGTMIDFVSDNTATIKGNETAGTVFHLSAIPAVGALSYHTYWTESSGGGYLMGLYGSGTLEVSGDMVIAGNDLQLSSGETLSWSTDHFTLSDDITISGNVDLTNSNIYLDDTAGMFMNTANTASLTFGSDAFQFNGPDDAAEFWVKEGTNPPHFWVKDSIANVLTLGAGLTGLDYQITFNGETNDGTLTYKEDEDSWSLSGEGISQTVHTDDVSNPPTDAELDTVFGTPATVGAGFTAYIDDNGGGANFYQVVSDGTNWWIFTGTIAGS